MQNGTDIVVRVSKAGDAAGIFALLKCCADEIPVEIDGYEGDRRFAGLLDCWSQNGSSFVAVVDERIVGFLLTSSLLEEDEKRLEYGAVVSNYRGRGIFPCMLNQAKAISARLDATVKDANKSDMAGRLKKAGFSYMGFSIPADGRNFLWTRSNVASGNSLPRDAEGCP
jgi:hypothetical protein